MSRQGLPLQEEQLSDSSLQEQQSSQHQQRRSENPPQPWQDEARSLSQQSPQQQQTRSQNPYESNFQESVMQSVYDQGQYFQNIQHENIQHYENYTISGYAQGANLNQQASGQHMYMFTEQGYNIEPQDLSQQVTYNQQSQRQMLQALSKTDKVPQDFSQNLPQYTQRMQNLQLHQTSDSDQQLEANNQQILNTPQHISHVSQKQQKAGSQSQQQKQHISQNLQHAQGIHLQQHRVYSSDQQSIQASNQRSYMEQQRRQNKSQQSATQSHPRHQISQRLQQQHQFRPFQQQGKKDQQQRNWDQSAQASNQRPYRKQQRYQDKSQQSATQSHPQHQISQRGSENLPQPWQDEARSLSLQEQSSQQQQQLRSFQQYQGKKNQQQRSWDQSVQASNQWPYRKQQRYQDKSQQSATQSHPQHQISQSGSENLSQPWQDEARSLSLQEQSSQQQQQLRSFQQYQGKKDQQQRSWDQSVQASNQWSYREQQRRQNKSQQSAIQSHPQHQISQSLQQQQQLSSFQGRKDQQQRIWNQQQHIKDNNMQQQQQITPDTLATLSQLTLKGTRELDMASSTMKDCQARIPKRQRKQPSSETAFITVNTNMFKIIFKNNFLKKAVHYDVDIIIEQPKVQTTSNRFSKALCRKIFEKCRSQHFGNRYPAFDGRKNAYSAYDLPFESNILETTVEISTCKQCPAECKRHLRKFIVILKKVAEIDLSWTRNLPSSLDEIDGYQTGIQVLDIIMRHKPESKLINVGRSFFWQDGLDNMNFDLTDGLRAARGGFLSVILGQQIYLNVDVVHKAFVIPQKVDILFENYHDDTINKLLKDLKVTCQIPGYNARSYRLDRLGLKCSNEQKFEYEKKKISVTDYFHQRYDCRLQQPTLPCLVVKGRQTYLPPELCTIESGQSVKKLNDIQTSNMIKIAAMSAPDRKKKIKAVFGKLVNDSDNCDDSNKCDNDIMEHEFQLSVENEMETVNARILNAPDIIYANNRKINVNKGTWQMQNFKQPINLENDQWTIFYIKDNKNKDTQINIFRKMKDFMEKLQHHARQFGMQVGAANTFKYFEKLNPIEIKKYFQQNKELKLIIVIIPTSSGTIYNEIKQIAELELGILTQCIKFSNFNKQSTSIIKNILLKINTKLNGINHALDPRPKCFEKICMFVGADVTHPSYDEGKPSIAAVTASNDIDGFQYNVIHKVLPSKQEIIMDLKNIIDVQLSIYKDKTSRLPERIIYYRDGVSEGQLPQVMHYEIEAIRDAYKNKCKSDIEITCLVVQKRHHVRLFPTSSEQTYDKKNENVQAGTIVDSEITHPSHFDFYLVSHASIQGTARPTKYKCICNDSNFTENEIEELTYYLCHMYARCTRTVSYPVPTYYAHLAAYRGKILLHGDNDDRLREIQERFNTKMANLPMYFV